MSKITCQVIDTRDSRPAIGMQVVLRAWTYGNPYTQSAFESRTTCDGRVDHWVSTTNQLSLQDKVAQTVAAGHNSQWQMGFDTTAYFGTENKCWSVVDINFVVKHMGNYHVSLFVGTCDYKVYLTPWKAPIVPDLELARTTIEAKRGLSTTQKVKLLEMYRKNPYPEKGTYDRIAGEFGVEKKEIQGWFSNERHRDRRQQGWRSNTEQRLPEKSTHVLPESFNNLEAIDPALMLPVETETIESQPVYLPLEWISGSEITLTPTTVEFINDDIISDVELEVETSDESCKKSEDPSRIDAKRKCKKRVEKRGGRGKKSSKLRKHA